MHIGRQSGATVTPEAVHETEAQRVADLEARARRVEIQRDLAQRRQPKPRPRTTR